jgi:hypothetical protein
MKSWELADKLVTQNGSHLSRCGVRVEYVGFPSTR